MEEANIVLKKVVPSLLKESQINVKYMEEANDAR